MLVDGTEDERRALCRNTHEVGVTRLLQPEGQPACQALSFVATKPMRAITTTTISAPTQTPSRRYRTSVKFKYAASTFMRRSRS
jgi:hypothetical protein